MCLLGPIDPTLSGRVTWTPEINAHLDCAFAGHTNYRLGYSDTVCLMKAFVANPATRPDALSPTTMLPNDGTRIMTGGFQFANFSTQVRQTLLCRVGSEC